jgi:hypothetical protein
LTASYGNLKEHMKVTKKMKIFTTQIVVILFLSISAFGQKSVASLEPAHAEALQKFLQANQNLEFLDESSFDAAEDGMLKFARKEINSKLTPYYLAADFNRDGFRDFAVILSSHNPPDDQGKGFGESHRYNYKLMIVVFNGSKNKTYKPVFKKQVESPLVCFLNMSYEKKKPRLYWAIIETDASFYVSPAGNGYIAETPDENH